MIIDAIAKDKKAKRQCEGWKSAAKELMTDLEEIDDGRAISQEILEIDLQNVEDTTKDLKRALFSIP